MPKKKNKKLRESLAVLEAVVQRKRQWNQASVLDTLGLNEQVSTVVQNAATQSTNMRPLIVENGVVKQYTEGDGVVVPGLASSNEVLLSPANGSRVKLGPVFLPTSRIVVGNTLVSMANGYAGYGPLGSRLTSNITAYVSSNGNDSTGNGAINNPYATISGPTLKYRYSVTEDYRIILKFTAGRWMVASNYQMGGQQSAAHWEVEGEVVTTTVSSVVSSNGSAGNYSVTVQLASAANINVNDYVAITNVTGGTNPERLAGCFLVTSLPGGNQIVINSRHRVGTPSGAVTGNCTCFKTIFSPDSSGGCFSVARGSVTFRNLCFTPNTTQDTGYAILVQGTQGTAIIQGVIGCESLNNGVNVSTGGQLTIQGCLACGDVMNGLLCGHGGSSVVGGANAVHINGGSGNGIHVANGSISLQRFTISGAAGHGIWCGGGGSLSVNGGLISHNIMHGIYANAATVHIDSAGLTCNNAGTGYSGIHLISSYLYSAAGANLVTRFNAQHGVNCTHSSYADIRTCNSSNNSNYGVYAAYNAFMDRTSATLSGNTGGANSPATTTLGNFESYIV